MKKKIYRKNNDNYLFLLLYYKNKFGIKTEKSIIKQKFSWLLIHVLINKIYAYVRYILRLPLIAGRNIVFRTQTN